MKKFAWIGALFLVAILAIGAHAAYYNIYGLIWDEGAQDWVGCGWGEKCSVDPDTGSEIDTWTDESGWALCINYNYNNVWYARWKGTTYPTVLAPGNPQGISAGYDATFLVE